LPVKKQIPLPAQCPRLAVSLNQDWHFRRIDESEEPGVFLEWDPATDGQIWEAVDLPHAARLDPLNASGGRNFQGVCWYSRKLDLPKEWLGKTVRLHFEGAMQTAEVWLNKGKIASNCCGYLPFAVDITPFLNFEREGNILTVRLDNRDDPQVPPGKKQRELDFSYFAGLYRNVRLEVVDRLHITDPILADKVAGGGVFVTFPKVSSAVAEIQIRTEVRNDYAAQKQGNLLQELTDGDGRVIAQTASIVVIAAGKETSITQTLLVPRPNRWHPDHPYLYKLRTTLLDGAEPADEIVTRIGIRDVKFDSRDGLFINGEKFFSLGVNRHQDHPYVGYALPDSAHYRDVKKLREAGFTSVRSHYPQAPAFMDACDELGMLAIVSNPGWQFVGGKTFQARAIQNARVMVRRDRNRPSVILWEAALNESDNKPIGPAMRRAVHEEYPGELCFTSGDRETEADGALSCGWDVEYLRNDGSRPWWIREWGDQVDNWSDQQSRSRVRRAWGETPMLIQAHSHATRLEEIISRNSLDSGTKNFHRLCGACLWAGIDCQRGYHHQPFYGGVLDLFRLPKFNYYFFASQRRPDVHVPGLDDGPVVFIANFATFLSPTTVTIFSNCDEVRLLMDGKEIGRKKPDARWTLAHPPFTFEVECFAHEQSTMYMTGVARVEKPPMELVAEGLIGGAVAAKHIVHPPGAPAKLLLHADFCGRELIADGSDWVRVHASVCDSRGTPCPLADDLVEFTVEGDGAVIGDRRIFANPVRAEAGIATALVRAGKRPGPLTIKAASFGLEPGQIEIRAINNSLPTLASLMNFR
jgi:beta-galactosidase